MSLMIFPDGSNSMGMTTSYSGFNPKIYRVIVHGREVDLSESAVNYYRSIDQSDFLLNLGFKKFLDQIRESDLPENQKNLNRKAMLDLIKPNGLGRFTVQSHSKKIEKEIHLDGFSIK